MYSSSQVDAISIRSYLRTLIYLILMISFFLLVGIPRSSQVANSLSTTPIANPVPTASTTGDVSASSCTYGEMLTRILNRLADIQKDGIYQICQQHIDHINAMDTLWSTLAPPSAKDIGDAVRDAVSDSVRTVVTPALCGITFTT